MMTEKQNSVKREGFCPVYDIECPGGSEASSSCDFRFQENYNPLVNFRDAEIEHCAIYRQEQEANRTSEDGN